MAPHTLEHGLPSSGTAWARGCKDFGLNIVANIKYEAKLLTAKYGEARIK